MKNQHHSKSLINNLLEVVDLLSVGGQSIVDASSENEKKVFKVNHDPLIVQLREAIRSSNGSHPVGGALPSERNVLDTDAFEKYEALKQKINNLFSEVSSAKMTALPEQILRQWFISFNNLYQQGKISDTVVEKKIKQLKKISSAIENKLNPPNRIEITAACPRCDATHSKDEHGIYRRAIVVDSRIDIYKSLNNSTAHCINCQALWIHDRGLRQLRWEIDQKEYSQNTDNHNKAYLEEISDIIGNAGAELSPYQDESV